jgi:HD-GYP domain-containing protein (c-di-GMP phosphodiesterase class II)
MFDLFKKPSSAILDRPRAVLGDPLHAWDVLDHFFQELQGIQRPSKEFRALVQAISQSIRADAVFVYAHATNELVEAVGPPSVTPAWCRQFAERILKDAAPGVIQVLRSDLVDSWAPVTVLPISVAMVQVSQSRQVWAVALSLTPGHVFNQADLKIMLLARRMLRNHFRQLRTVNKLKETLIGIVHCLTASVEAKDPYTCGHSERVARIAVRLGKEMQLPKTEVSDIYLAGLLHDIGKIGIKDSVLQKPGKLTEEETLHVQEHTLIGAHLIAQVQQLAHLRPGVRNHHERYDGGGYPDGLAGEDIPLLARILAVADSCDAMMSARPYRSAMPVEQIDSIMADGAGSQWDMKIVQPFMVCRSELYSICQRGIGDSLCMAVDHAVTVRNKPGALSANGRPSEYLPGKNGKE